MSGNFEPLKVDRIMTGLEMKPIYGPGMSMTDLPEGLLKQFMKYPTVGYLSSQLAISDVEACVMRLPARQDVYAQIRSADRGEIASVSNEGDVKLSESASPRVRRAVEGRSIYLGLEGKSGPDLAQAVAERLAEAESGDLIRSATALTQSHFEALSSGAAGWQDMPTVDYLALREGMKFDWYDKARAELARRAAANSVA